MDALLISLWGLITGSILLVSFNGNDKSGSIVKDPDPVVVQLADNKADAQTAVKKEKKPKKESKWRRRRKAVSEMQPLLFKQTQRYVTEDVITEPEDIQPVEKVVVKEVKEEVAKVEEVAAAEVETNTEPKVEAEVKTVVEEDELVAEPAPVLASNVKLPKGLSPEKLMIKKDGTPQRHKLKSGETLSDVAHQYYEDACFWPYIYEVNKNKLSSPDKLQVGMLLYLPSKSYYKIDGNSQTSVSKAKSLISKYIK